MREGARGDPNVQIDLSPVYRKEAPSLCLLGLPITPDASPDPLGLHLGPGPGVGQPQ